MNVSRRMLLAATPGLLAAPALLSGAAPSSAQTVIAGAQAPGFYRTRVGDLIVTAINDGFALRPIEGFIRNAELPAVQKALADAFIPGDRLPIPFTTLAVQSADRLVLIDTGNGDMGAPTSGLWGANFAAAGFKPENVTHVVFSHFHGDHINGLRLKDGTLRFPNAQIMVPAAEWAHWMSDEIMGRAPEAARGAFQNVRRVFGPIAANVARFEADKEILPGITSIAAYGHTPGHTLFRIASGDKGLLALGDLTNHPALFVRNPDWSAIFDMDADAARATRRRVLDMAATDRTQVAFYHAPFPATGFITRTPTGFDLVPAQWTSAT